MLNKYGNILLIATFTLVAACAPSKTGGGGDDDDHPGFPDGSTSEIDASDPNQGFIDAAVLVDATPNTIDAGNVYPDATPHADGGCAATQCPNPVQPGCGSTEICGNGSDDNCDGNVDENCPCSAGAVQACFASPPGFRHKGACQDGQQTCQGSGEFAHWGPCTGGILPHAEACDSVDNDCNGCVDDDSMCCEVDLMCPSAMPDGQPFTDYVINGMNFYSGPVMTWKWEVTGGPCDQLLAPKVSYTLNGMQVTSVTGGAALSTLTFHPTLSGDYTVHVTMTLPDGTIYECTFIVHIGGPGLRVELCWDTTGVSDVDLHLHKPGSTTPWFNTTPSTTGTTLNTEDCHYANCTALDYSLFGTPADWGYAHSPLSECQGGPEGPNWVSLGYCASPRLDIDNISTPGKPENINVDKPENNKTYRAAVHYYGGSVTTHPMVNVYCGGHLQATYGKAPDLVTTFGSGGPSHAEGPIWRVVDVTTHVDASGNTTSCDLSLLHQPGMTNGYYVTCPKPGSAANCSNLNFN